MNQKDRDATSDDFVLLGKGQGLKLSSTYIEIIKDKNKTDSHSASCGFWKHHSQAITEKKSDLKSLGASDADIKIFIDSINSELNLMLCYYVSFGIIDKLNDNFDICVKDINYFLSYDPSEYVSMNSPKDEFETVAINAGIAAANLFYVRMHFMPIELVSQFHKSTSSEQIKSMYSNNLNQSLIEFFCKEADKFMYEKLKEFSLSIIE